MRRLCAAISDFVIKPVFFCYRLEELMKDLVQLEVKKNMDATEAEEMAQSLNEMGQAFERGSNSYSSLPVRSQGGGGYQPSGTLKKLFFR